MNYIYTQQETPYTTCQRKGRLPTDKPVNRQKSNAVVRRYVKRHNITVVPKPN